MAAEFQIGVLDVGNGQEEVWKLRAEEEGESCIELASPKGARWSATGDDLFEALKIVRLQIEPLGYLLLCNGARIDAHPSGMSREATGGRTLYLLKANRAARTRVFIFDRANLADVGTVADQWAFYQAWLRLPHRQRLIDRARDAVLELWIRWRDR
ncbi:hypothetical protein J7E99_31335 [Streptomyces sp. ISL-44]|uniref:hypothetical protein n=1 Tax=Streptomyces sp. ISL-44 TaxID=2819184 RepID=UPI001BEC1B90|nr:hypothetical protein [Streptomyces sp. ISL-44]MBT2545074.1 hypothetical protein [Streptomyces sp. ISL-44]